ncbi:putative disease resistance protein [Acorus calamus]|uniref:Disease resistance protein n=1 Tax=Acorus calamus TaxID=4465 RepID=A0AAV9D7Z6_ACOCL|nr:putative disease resistance protein [Acorus calamus]
MANAAVSYLLGKVDQLIQKAFKLSDVPDEVRKLKDQFSLLQEFLKEVNGRPNDDRKLRNEWLKRLRTAVNEVEDIIDDYVLDIEYRKKSCIIRVWRNSRNLIKYRDTGASITAITEKIKDIFSDEGRYKIQIASDPVLTTDLQRRKPTDIYPEIHDEIIGFDDDARRVVSQLTVPGDELRVVTIVGMGGLGKTTLAKKVYNVLLEEKVYSVHLAKKLYSVLPAKKRYNVEMGFECVAWVSVGQNCKEEQLLKELIKNTTHCDLEDLNKMGRNKLEDELNQYLKNKRFLIVMDDVWEDGLWKSIERAFRDIKNGSRVLFTSRSYSVAMSANPNEDPYELRFLNENERRELFNKKVSLPSEIPTELNKMFDELVEKCKGLPLAIVVLSGLLADDEWNALNCRKVLDTLDWRFDPRMKDCSDVLALSYRDMPDELKSCFLYLGLFPLNAEIRSSKLKMLWIAEGFVEAQTRKQPEYIAEEYLEKLYQRSLIQVAAKKSYGRSRRTCGIKSCRIHDLLRDLAISVSKCEFHCVYENQYSEMPSNVCRRLSIHGNVSNEVPPNKSSPSLRSLLCFNRKQFDLTPLVQGLRFLKVIDMEDVDIIALPEEVGRLIHLRFLGLKNTNLESIPSTVGDLFNLQTFDIRSNGKLKVPASVWKLKNLRHFYLDWCSPSQIQGFSNIHTLNGIAAGGWIEKSLSKLITLSKLGITKISLDHGTALSNALPMLKCLRYLALKTEGQSPVPTNLQFSVLENLYLLTLFGRLGELPNNFPSMLTKLSLRWSRLNKDPLPILGNLQSLESLKLLKDSYTGTKMVCHSSCFPKLKFLTFEELDNLQEWKVEDGAMTSLRHLVVSKCKKLEMLPEGLKHAKSFQELELAGMPVSFRNRVQQDFGESWRSIHRTTSIIFIHTANQLLAGFMR